MKSNKLKNLFASLKGKKLLVIKVSGNYGDELLQLGAYSILNELSIDYTVISVRAFLSLESCNTEAIYIHGGGAFNDIWITGIQECFEKAIRFPVSNLILGPQAFTQGITGFKDRLDSAVKHKKAKHIDVFARDMVSFQLFSQISPAAISLCHDHDTALNLSISELLPSLDNQCKGSLFAIRNDKEGIPLLPGSSFCFWFDPIKICKSFEEWIGLHSRFSTIITNRLHSAVLGSILGKKVLLLPNSYHKNKAMWDYSLKDKNVEFIDPADSPELFDNVSASRIKKRVFSSCKYGRFLFRVSQIGKTHG